MGKLLVSVCIPTFNGALFIKEALESVKKQTYTNLEIIVSDDNSSDDTCKIIESFKSKTSIPVYIYKHKPMGIGANWNHCIEKANGTYIKFLFQDDFLEPNCVRQMVDLIEGDDSIGLVSCKRTFIIEDEHKENEDWISSFGDLQTKLNLDWHKGYAIIDKSLFKHKAFLKSPLNKIGEPSTYLFRKSLLNDVGYFDVTLSQILDYMFCYRVLKKYRIAVIEKPLIRFRLHKDQATKENLITENNDAEAYKKILYKEFLSLVDNYLRLHLLKRYHWFYKLKYFIISKFRHD